MHRILAVLGLAAASSFAAPGFAEDPPPSNDQLFESLDANRDGRLTADEIKDEQRRFFDRLVRVGDKNDDRALSKAEFIAAIDAEPQAVTPPAGDEGDRRGRPGRGMMTAEMFDRMDADKDGKVTLNEIPERLREALRPAFERTGRDALTLEELQRLRLRANDDPGQMVRNLRRLDADGNGKLTKAEVPEEFRERMRPLFDRSGTEEIDIAAMERMTDRYGDRRPGAEGDRRPMEPGESRPAMERGERPEAGEGRPGMRLIAVLDEDGDRQLSADELARAGEKFAELDRNHDGRLDPSELMGFPERGDRFGPPGEMRRRPGGDENRPGERPGERPRRPASDERPSKPRSP